MALLPYDEARAHVLAACAPGAPVNVPVREAHGLVLAEPVVAAAPVPSFANTAMDGFAVRASDTHGASDAAPRALRIVATVRAGESSDRAVEEGEAIRIMTGAPMPHGADAVVMVERTRVDEGVPSVVLVSVEVAPGNHVRPVGDDVAVGDVVFAAGEELSAGHLGVLTSIGRADIVAVPRLRVGVFSTGDELVPVGEPLGRGQIHDSNRITLLSLIEQSGFEAVDLGLVRDDDAAIEATIAEGAAGCDALVTSGGVSMGDFDLVKVVLDRVGDMRWMQIAIKPAKPFAFGLVRSGGRTVPVFGLPGNPVSSMVSFELLARPALRRMAGHGDASLDRLLVSAVADHELARRPDGKVHYVRVLGQWDAADGRLHVASAGAQGSHQLSAMARANGLAVLEDGSGVRAGQPVPVIVLRP